VRLDELHYIVQVNYGQNYSFRFNKHKKELICHKSFEIVSVSVLVAVLI
jgi:hypothetical protein